MLRGLALTLALSPVLAGCVVYSNEAGEHVVVGMDTELETVAAETVRGVVFDGGRLNVTVDSNGCTDVSDFEVKVSEGEPTELTLKRVTPDLCKALAPDGVVVSWTYAELGLETDQTARLVNPLRL